LYIYFLCYFIWLWIVAGYDVVRSGLLCGLQRIMPWIAADYAVDCSGLCCGLQRIMLWIATDYDVVYSVDWVMDRTENGSGCP
jgi:hypothetical protein